MGWPETLEGADRAELAIFGEPALYVPGVGAPVEVQGIFDSAYRRSDAGAPGVTNEGPAIWFRVEDLPSDPATDAAAVITVRGADYKAWDAQRDGHGGILVPLHRA